MTEMIFLLNYITVTVFGCVLAAVFCGMGKSRKSRIQIAGMAAVTLMIQGIYYYYTHDTELIRQAYPILTHLPLVLSLCCVTRKKLWSCTCVLLAYLCCQLRRWFGLAVLMMIHGSDVELAVIEMIITVPVLSLLLRYKAGDISRLSAEPVSVQIQFCVVPFLYYIFDYLAIVYTDWLYNDIPAVVEFMPFVCCASYLSFLLYTSAGQSKRLQLEGDRKNLNIQVVESIRELSVLREAQQRAAVYRHDLRHHLQYLAACIENDELEQAKEYINRMYKEIDAQKVTPYCENEAVNLILSAYYRKAEKKGIQMDIQVAIAQIQSISVNDLCVLLSNGLENAWNACLRLPTERKALIRVQGYERNGKIFLQIINSCREGVVFLDGLPAAQEAGHGIGTRSIQMIVEHYGGICSFSEENGMFALRISV